MSPLDEVVASWLDKADGDMRMASLGLTVRPPVPWIVGFHAQQAAEKLLKGFLTFRSVEFEKTHNIGYLLQLCEELEPRFAALCPKALKLSYYAVQARYPLISPEPSEAEAREAAAIAEQVRALVFSVLPPRFSVKP